MGRIKTQMIKRLTFALRKAHPQGFSQSFDENKKLTEQYLEGPSKKIRNTIAGYLSRLAKRTDLQ